MLGDVRLKNIDYVQRAHDLAKQNLLVRGVAVVPEQALAKVGRVVAHSFLSCTGQGSSPICGGQIHWQGENRMGARSLHSG